MIVQPFLQIANLLPDAVLLLSADGTVVAANRCAAEQLDMPAPAFHGRPLSTWVVTPPQALEKYLRACWRTRYLLPGNLLWRTPEGRQLSLSCAGALLPPCSEEEKPLLLLRLTPRKPDTSPERALNRRVDELTQEIASRQQYEEELQTRERRFRAIVENSWEAFALIGADGTIRYASPSTVRLLGYTPEEFVGRHAFDAMHPADRPQMSALFAQLLQSPGASLTASYRYQHKDGSWRWLEGTGTNLLSEPAVQAIVANYRDITEQRQALVREQQVRAEADHRKDQFLSMLAHELRNPLAPLLTGLQVMRQAGAQATREQTVAMMERQVRHLSRLLDELLQVSRLQRGRIVLRPERLDLARLVRTTTEDRRATLERAGLTLAVDTPAVPVWVRGDATRLVQVLEHLLENAAKFTDRGGWVTVALRADSVHQQAVLSVSDTGIGMEPDMVRRLFDTFAQADRSLDRARGGLGLGLALVKGLVELHEGAVEAASQGLGRGAEFTVRLPLQEEPPALSQMPTAATPARERRRILVIEDNRDTADSLRLLLELLGHEVRVAYTGPQGVQAATEWRPQVVVSDIGLPGGLDGFGVATELRRHPETAQAVLIALTGYGSDADRRQAQESGFDRLLTKPADPEELQELLVRPARA